jgi:SAM-dependent methyltransferase
MMEVFGSAYGEAYDLLYHDKDYAAECDLIERIFQTYGRGPIRSVLDLGCGTGNHAIPLSQRGYEVVGVDRSESMLVHAQRKIAHHSRNGRLVVQQGDIRGIDLHKQFDAALMMFAVLGYQLENADVLAAIRNARRHLHVGALLLFDVWYGPAVLHQGPSQRIKVVPRAEGRTLRAASGELNARRHMCRIHFHVWRFEKGQLVAETEESHEVRYFFPLELDLLLESSGFAPLRLGAFPKFDKEPDETTWNVLGVARAI